MSSIARFSYKNVATVYPFEGEDPFNGGSSFGAPYTIACTWTGKSEQRRDNDGAEFVTKNIFWTEDQRPRYKDRIAMGDTLAAEWQDAKADEIRTITNWDMSPFGETDSPDFELVT